MLDVTDWRIGIRLEATLSRKPLVFLALEAPKEPGFGVMRRMPDTFLG